ncbi:MAG TPA: nickel transporter [Burkholderiales bacterium]|nr:nickel transporter [Burkholderiales bacterium]
MDSLPSDLVALCTLVFTLGLKHGLDADHLVTIDGLTRFNSVARPRLARWCGLLFSVGHGAVVVAIALAVGVAAERWMVPDWLEGVGAWISIAFLAALGLLNLAAVVSAEPHEVVQTVAVKGRLLAGLTRTSRPAAMAAVGALFALSFDTVSQAALFAFTATRAGGWEHALALGLLFTLGMMLADGANGLWIATLLRRADRRARIASRTIGLVIAGLSLAVAAYGVARFVSPEVADWGDGRELALGLGVLAIVAVSYVVARLLARTPVVGARDGAR